uniref:DUF5685 family protein n=1 Tax=Candidatus Fimivicinus sp. TaxID=3056640 RepID=UPI003FED6579
MFGYVKAYKPELKVRDYEQYKAVYCSLCKELGRGYGLFARMTLSYDFTFAALLRLSLSEQCPGFQKARCPFNPFAKCHTCSGGESEFSFTAAAAVIMTFYKLRDNLRDAGFWKRLASRLLNPLAAHAHNKAKRRYPRVEEIVSHMMEEQALLEEEDCGQIDRAADPTAKALAALFSMDAQTEDTRRVLDRLGYCVGRWVYLIDAADDLADDLESGDYNPYVCAFQIAKGDLEAVKAARQNARESLFLTAAEAVRAYDLLEVRRFDAILRNILTDGLFDAQKLVFRPKETGN